MASGRTAFMLAVAILMPQPKLEVSFWHHELPIACITPLVFIQPGIEEFPGIGSGTGFFASVGSDVYLITARHCLQSSEPPMSVHQIAKTLTIPFELEGKTTSTNELIEFRQLTQLALDKTQTEFLDIVALQVQPREHLRHQTLLKRAAKLPPTGLWLDGFVNSPIVSEAFNAKASLPFVITGYPNKGTATQVRYADETGNIPEVQTQAIVISGNLRRSSLDHCLRLEDVNWPHGHEGLSGSPVFVKFGTRESPRCALAGMVICGSTKKLNFIQISSIRQAIGHTSERSFN